MGNGSFPFRQRYTLGLCVCVSEGRKAVIACQSFPGGSFLEKASRVVVKLKKKGHPSLFICTHEVARLVRTDLFFCHFPYSVHRPYRNRLLMLSLGYLR